MLVTFAEAERGLDNAAYLRIAERSAGFLLRNLRKSEGRLRHVWYDG